MLCVRIALTARACHVHCCAAYSSSRSCVWVCDQKQACVCVQCLHASWSLTLLFACKDRLHRHQHRQLGSCRVAGDTATPWVTWHLLIMHDRLFLFLCADKAKWKWGRVLVCISRRSSAPLAVWWASLEQWAQPAIFDSRDPLVS